MNRGRAQEPRQDVLTELGCACATARRVARLLTQVYDRHLRIVGLEAPQFALLMALDSVGPAPQGSLGQRHAMDKTTVSRNIGLLRRKGWIAMSQGTDRRERWIALTRAGRRKLAEARPAWMKAQAALRDSMATSEWRALFIAFSATARAAQAIHDRLDARG